MLAQPNVTAVVVDPRRPEQLAATVAAADLRVTPEERHGLTELFA